MISSSERRRPAASTPRWSRRTACTPFLRRDLTSWVHEELLGLGLAGDYADNRPCGLRCVHPFVTLVEKLDAIARRWPREDTEASVLVRHYEDAARIIFGAPELPVLDGYPSIRDLAAEMLAGRQIRAIPCVDDAAFAPAAGGRWDEVRTAHEAIAALFWGPRVSLDEACAAIRGWTARELGSGS